jgi:sulfide:quinone oxidoreductase
MNTKHHQIVIIGAGTAGITVAARLLNEDRKLDVVIIDPASKHYYQPAWTLVGGGTFNYKKTERDMAGLIPSGATWLQDHVESVDPDQNQVTTRQNGTITYDYLIACPGIQINLDALPGLKETLGKNNVSSVYVNPEYTWEVLQNFKKGTALFTQAPTPIKCGGAPQKIMYLSDDYFRKTGVRNDINVVFAVPGSVIFGVEPFKSTLMKVVERKDIFLRFYHKLTRIDGENKIAYYTITLEGKDPDKLFYNQKDIGEQWTSETEVAIPFDLMHLAPPQSAPDFIRESKLAHQDGPNKGWIETNHYTMQHQRYANVFAIGDAAALPTAKTGAAIRKQAPVLVAHLMAQMKNQAQPEKTYNGYSSCPIVTGYGKMLLAEFKYDGVRDSDPMITRFVNTSKEQYSMWLLKKYGLPFMYWNLMLKGRA